MPQILKTNSLQEQFFKGHWKGTPESHPLLWKLNRPKQIALKTVYFNPKKYSLTFIGMSYESKKILIFSATEEQVL